MDTRVLASEPVPGGIRLELEPGASPVSGACELRFPEEAPVLGARLLTGAATPADLPPMALRLATTRGTNALLTRQGGSVALFITRGFADLLAVGTQQRPDLFALEIRKPRPYYDAVVEVSERLAADGSVLQPLTEETLDALRPKLEELRERGIGGAAIALLHGYRNPEHETRLAQILTGAGFPWVVTSSDLAPLIGILPRAETVVVEAFLAPVIRGYLAGVAKALTGDSTLHVMTSAGGLARAEEFRAKDSLLSGPAGGVVGAARAGRRSGFERVIPFDMGGTSTDVARVDGDFEYVFEHHVGDAHLVAPALAIESVAAGGGSICRFDGDRLRVGPESAGAHPGPACYGAGGPLTLTDVNLLLGRLDPERFGIPIDVEAARAALEALRDRVSETGPRPPARTLLIGLLRIADERMADAIREISVRRGYDPGEYALVAFGGAGAQHACAVAGQLGIATVVVPEDAGLLSARGLGVAVLERFAQRQVLRPLADLGGELAELLGELAAEARRAVAREARDEEIEIRRRIVHLRFMGQDSTIPVEVATGEESEEAVRQAFDRAYRTRYGYRPETRQIEVESVRVVASSRNRDEEPPPPVPESSETEPSGARKAVLAGTAEAVGDAAEREVATYERTALAPGARLSGPALVFELHSATVVAPGWTCRVDGAAALVLERKNPATQDLATGT